MYHTNLAYNVNGQFFYEGSWVQANYNGQAILGFIESFTVQQTLLPKANVRVTMPEKLRGTIMQVPLSNLVNVPDCVLPEETSDLINLALDTRDEEWFREITSYQKMAFMKIGR